MKTIEKAAREYAEKCYPYSENMRMQCETHFEAGAAFVHRWIPVEEALPQTNKPLLIKYWIGVFPAVCRMSQNGRFRILRNDKIIPRPRYWQYAPED
jgi:hypothetical protein